MGPTEQQTNYVGTLVVVLMIFISAASCNSTQSVASATSSWFTVVNSTSTTAPHSEILRTTASSAQTTCALAALDPFQQKIIYDKVQRFNLIEYLLVFPNNTVNPLKHNMKHIFKVCLRHFHIWLVVSFSCSIGMFSEIVFILSISLLQLSISNLFYSPTKW